MHDETDVFGPNGLGNLSFQHRRDDEVRRVLPNGVKHRRIADGERDVDNMSELGQFDKKSLAETVMRCGEKKYLHRLLRARCRNGAKPGVGGTLMMSRILPPPFLNRSMKTAVASAPRRPSAVNSRPERRVE